MNTQEIMQSLTGSTYAACLGLCSVPSQSARYIYKSVHRDLFYIGPAQDKTQKISKEFRPLSFREITWYGIRLRSELAGSPKDAFVVSTKLQAINQELSSEEKKHNVFIRVARLIYDCALNLFHGCGFISTSALAARLSDELAKVKESSDSGPSVKIQKDKNSSACKDSPIPAPSSETAVGPSKVAEKRAPLKEASVGQLLSASEKTVPPIKPVFVRTTSEIIQKNRRDPSPPRAKQLPHGTSFYFSPAATAPKEPEGKKMNAKSRALMCYKDNPNECTCIQKGIVFNDIKLIVPKSRTNKNLDPEAIISVVDLMRYTSGLTEVDLRNPLCGRVIVDIFKECKKNICEQLADWLCLQPTFNVQLLKQSLNVFVEKEAGQKPYSLTALERLLRLYVGRSWNGKYDKEKKLILPINDPVLSGSVEVLLREAPNENKVCSLVEWMADQKEFDLQTFKNWILVFLDKERTKGAFIPELYYPTRDKLIEQFKKNGWTLSKLHEETKSDALVQYLKQKGVG